MVITSFSETTRVTCRGFSREEMVYIQWPGWIILEKNCDQNQQRFPQYRKQYVWRRWHKSCKNVWLSVQVILRYHTEMLPTHSALAELKVTRLIKLLFHHRILTRRPSNVGLREASVRDEMDGSGINCGPDVVRWTRWRYHQSSNMHCSLQLSPHPWTPLAPLSALYYRTLHILLLTFIETVPPGCTAMACMIISQWHRPSKPFVVWCPQSILSTW